MKEISVKKPFFITAQWGQAPLRPFAFFLPN